MEFSGVCPSGGVLSSSTNNFSSRKRPRIVEWKTPWLFLVGKYLNLQTQIIQGGLQIRGCEKL